METQQAASTETTVTYGCHGLHCHHPALPEPLTAAPTDRGPVMMASTQYVLLVAGTITAP